MSITYFNVAHAVDVHNKIIDTSGGVHGFIGIELLQSVLELVKYDNYYPELEDKATYLFFSINKNHAFYDGNKRSSIALTAYFLGLNFLGFKINRFIKEMENIAIDVADNKIDKDLLFEIIFSLMYEDDFSEELKLKIAGAKGLK